MDNSSYIWDKACNMLRDDLSQLSFDSWIHPIQPVSLQGDEIILMVPNSAVRDMIMQRYSELVLSALKAASLNDAIVPKYMLKNELEAQASKIEQERSNTQLNPKYTFSSFVVGKSNQFSRAAAVGAAESPGTLYNPLFLYSNTGLGKTHLMHAIGNYILDQNPNFNIMYVTSEKFTNDLVLSLQTGRNNEFREKYRDIDVLLLDDIQFITNKPATQEEFFHTFNTLYEAGKQIVLTSDKPPTEIKDLEERLLSRFQWGLIADIMPPDYETRVAILLRKAEMEHIEISDMRVLDFIASRAESNVRELEGSLTRVMAYAALTGQPLTMELAEEALKDYYPRERKKPITPQAIQQAVCNQYSVSMDELTSKRKSRDIARPRQVAMYLMCTLTNTPLTKIGDLFGKRDHTTVMHARDTIAAELRENESLKEAIDDIMNRLTT